MLAQHYSNIGSTSRVCWVTVSASSAAAERLFSIVGKVVRPERCQLSDSMFQKKNEMNGVLGHFCAHIGL